MTIAPLDAAGLKPFSYTYFVYREGDNLGKLMALVSLTPVFIMVSYATLIATRRDVYLVAICLGQLVGEGVGAALKEYIRDPRPTRCLWYLFTTRILLPFVEARKLLRHPLAVAFCIRDTSNVGDLTRCEYEGILAWEKQAGLRDRGLAGTGVGKSTIQTLKKRAKDK
ncbi:Dolichyldiphosphatase 1 [Entophlyctis luteolus]|nr:Dolichyldiphosphatase 1 [Entophlyctis luteolus]